MGPGFPGSGSTVLAAFRGEIDLVSHTFQSILSSIEAGDLKPLLQIGTERISPHKSLEGVPLLGGAGGVAAIRAAARGEDIHQARRDAQAVIDLLGAGVLAAAPLGAAALLAGFVPG